MANAIEQTGTTLTVDCKGAICYSKTLSSKANVNILPMQITIQDTSESYNFTFDGGSDTHYVQVKEIGKGKSKSKVVNIYRKWNLDICPMTNKMVISLIPKFLYDEKDYESIIKRGYATCIDTNEDIPVSEGYLFLAGFALNQWVVRMLPHHKFDLNPVYYCRIGRIPGAVIYLVVPILDGRKLPVTKMNKLEEQLNPDIAKLVNLEYFKLKQKTNEFNFHMADTEFVPEVLYHKDALVKAFKDGKLKLAATFDIIFSNYLNDNPLILEPDAYHHVFPNGQGSYLKTVFPDCKAMMNFCEDFINNNLI
jgi:hypothetical protein